MKQVIPFIAIFFFAMPLALAQEGRLRALSGKEQAIRLERAHTIMENQDLPPAIQEFVEDHGWRSGRIVGGEDADIAMFPWHVGLMSSWGSQYCAGSIIHPEWILTAAHCSSPSFIRAGVTDRTDDTGQEVDVAYMIDHPDHHSPVQHANDIALIKLSEPLDISDPNVSVIQTVTQADALAGITDPGVMSTITGWGATSQGGPSSDILQKADVPIVSNEDAMDPGGYADGSITDDMLAAGFLGEGGVDACQGDSGGPLVVPDGNGGFRLAGVTTWGTGCARPDYPGIYARVSYFEEWIREYVELVDPDAPAKPANFKATAGDMGALQVELSWENPDRTVGEDPLNDLDAVHLYRSGELIYTIDDPTIGGSETYMDEDLTESGTYAYTVLGENANGEGISAIVTPYVGIDYPGAPEDVHLTADGNDGVLKWNAPTEGLHGGYFNDSNLTYTIVRLPDEVEVASGIAEENFTDSQVPEAGNYLYAVTTHNDKGKGGTGESNALLLGAENHLIFEGFEDEWPPLGWINNGWEQSTWGDPHSGEEFAYSNLAGSTLKTPVITLPENNKYRLTFYFRAESIDYPQDLDVRISVNNGDFSNIFSVADYDNATYEEVTVSLAEYDGSDVQIKFVGLTGAGGWAYGVLLDDVSVYMPFDNDLAAESISGITTPSAGIESNYTIEVTNAGLLPQDEYVVKLMQEGDVEIASLNGQSLKPGETMSYEFSWIPTEEGPTYLYGYVDFPDDEVPGNNQTPPLNISVQPGDIMVTSIGDEEDLDQQPFNFLWNYSIAQTLYFPHEIGVEGGVITGLQYYNNFSRDFDDTEIMIFLGETEAEDLSSGWTDPASLDLVFEGYYDFPAGEHELFFSFDDIYIYGGGNLVIYTVKGFPDWDIANQFYNTTDEGSNRSRRAENDDAPYDPLNPEADGSPNDRFPNVSLFFSTAGLGALEGTVTENDDPLEGVKVKVMGTNSVAETNEDGEFEITALLADTYDIHFSKLGYNDITLDDVVVEEDQTTTINASMDAIPTVTVSGFVGGSDFPDAGIEGAAVKLMGYDDYEVHTHADGEFEITGVYVHNVYDIYVSYEGYYSYADKITLDDTDMELDDIILTEIAFPVSNVVAEEVTEGAMITWGGPAPSEFRYDDGEVYGALGFPQGNWNSVMGAVHFRSAQLHEITWLLHEDSGPHATVKDWVLGLGEDGIPERDNVLGDGRALETFEVWRFLVEDEADMDAWTLIAKGIEEWEYLDDDWFDLDAGMYKYAVVAVYTNEVQSPPALSNELAPSMRVAFTVNVTTNSGDSPEGALLTLAKQTGDENHIYTMTAPADGEVIYPSVWAGIYDLHITLIGYEDYEAKNIEIDDEGMSHEAELIADDVSIAHPEDIEINLYPNPASDMLHIESNTILSELRMADMLGNMVYETKLMGKSHRIQVSGLLQGIYFIQLTTETGIITKRVQVTQ